MKTTNELTQRMLWNATVIHGDKRAYSREARSFIEQVKDRNKIIIEELKELAE